MSKHHASSAAQYLRMSTDFQDLSLSVQEEATRRYAQAQGLTIVSTYRDEGRSGLTLKQRSGMQQLLKDVAEPDCSFQAVLVYDVSRWGRFQDTDASAYYEYHCRLHGVDVVYVNEPFNSDRSAFSSLIKSIKRVMAAEYSRELGVKVRAGQDRAIHLGFQMGALPALGLVRAAVSKDGLRTRTLVRHERKGMQWDRIRWVLGSSEEVALVRRIFSIYITTHLSIHELARKLAAEGVVWRNGLPLSCDMLQRILQCEAYIGNFLWGRKAYPIGERRSEGDSAFIRSVGVIEPIISSDVWERAQTKRLLWRKQSSDGALLLEQLRRALDQNPNLNILELNGLGCRGAASYRNEFGSMAEAVRLVGGDPAQVARRRGAVHHRTHQLVRAIFEDIQALLVQNGVTCSVKRKARALSIADLQVKVHLIRQLQVRAGRAWYFDRRQDTANWVLLARMLPNDTAFDFFLLDPESYRRFPTWTVERVPNHESIKDAGTLIRLLMRTARRYAFDHGGMD